MGTPSEQRFLIQRDNLVDGITPVASSTKPADDTIHKTATVRAGSSTGRVVLSAPSGYTADDDATFDVEIVSGASSTARASNPQFVGTGSGTLAVTNLDAAVNDQTITATLIDLGTSDEYASFDLYGNIFRAASTGSSGNNLRLIVDPTNAGAGAALGAITRTSLDYSLISDLPADQQRFVGAQWQTPGSFPLQSGGILHPNSKRVAFTGFPTAYRVYLAIEDGKTVVYYDKPVVRTVPSGTVLQEVTGAYTVTLTNGTDSEEYVDIVTLYDLFRALLSSALGQFQDPFVITDDQTPGGMAVDELPLLTSPWVLGVSGNGSDYAETVNDLSVTASTGAPTETLTLTCVNNNTIGREVWGLRGTVSGALPSVTTGVAYASGYYGLLVPVQTPTDGVETKGDVSIRNASFASDDPLPQPCLERYVLGAAAINKTFRFTWTARPSTDCDCSTVTLVGKPDFDCLGIGAEDSTLTTLAAGHAARLQDLYDWYTPFLQGNAGLGADGTRTAINDGAIADEAFNIMRDLVTDLYTHSDATLSGTTWAASTAISLYAVYEPTTRNNYLYRATVAGTTAGSEPTWPTTIGNTVVDGGVTWTCIAKIPEVGYDDLLDSVETTVTGLETFTTEYDLSTMSSAAPLATSTAYSVGDFALSANGFLLYRCVKAGTTSAAGGVTYADKGGITIDGTAWFLSLGDSRFDNDSDDIAETENYFSEPHISRAIADFAKAKWLSEANRIRSFAGIDAGKSSAGSSIITDGCWEDEPGEAFYFAVEDSDGNAYLPMFVNQGWHSSRVRITPDGQEEWYSTQEIWLGIKIGCYGSLQVGDSFDVVVGGVSNERSKAYLVGDTLAVEIIGASELYMTGGVTGDNTHTWAVYGTDAGALADYSVIDGAEVAYSALSGDLQFLITRGGNENSLGDRWTFQIFSKQWRWRKDSGSWSSAADIPDGTVALSDGIEAEFIGGSGISFEDDDLFSFTVYQPYSPSNALLSDRYPWEWSGASANWVTDFGSDQSVDTVAIWHALPTGATVTIEGLNAADSVLWTETPTVTDSNLILALLATSETTRKVRVSVASATDGAIRWIWAGVGLSVEWDADTVQPIRGYALAGQVYRGAGYGLRVAWSNQSGGSAGLPIEDIDTLVAMVDSLRQANNLPSVVIGNRDQSRGYLCRLSDDDIEIDDLWQMGTTDASDHVGVALNFERVIV